MRNLIQPILAPPPNFARSKFEPQCDTLKYLPKVAIHLGLVVPVRVKRWAFKDNRTARAYVMGPSVEPPQDRYLQRRCSIKNVYT